MWWPFFRCAAVGPNAYRAVHNVYISPDGPVGKFVGARRYRCVVVLTRRRKKGIYAFHPGHKLLSADRSLRTGFDQWANNSLIVRARSRPISNRVKHPNTHLVITMILAIRGCSRGVCERTTITAHQRSLSSACDPMKYTTVRALKL
jgi:hypothetical protein